MFKGRSYFSLAAHTVATVTAIVMAVSLVITGNQLMQFGYDNVEAGAGIFSMLLFFIAVLAFAVAIIPFIAVLIGWAAFFAKVPWLTLVAVIAYGLVALTGNTDNLNLYFIPSAALGFVGWLQERKTKRSAKPSSN